MTDSQSRSNALCVCFRDECRVADARLSLPATPRLAGDEESVSSDSMSIQMVDVRRSSTPGLPSGLPGGGQVRRYPRKAMASRGGAEKEVGPLHGASRLGSSIFPFPPPRPR